MHSKISRIHFVGIGGTGMSGLAEVLLNLGYEISGSDCAPSETVERLRRLGAEVHIGHDRELVHGRDLVVLSSAIRPGNAERREARKLGIPVLKRGQMLAEIMRLKFGIAVAGAHGKTTTTSLIARVLSEADLDPTVVVGGRLRALGSNARLGSGEFLVAEADESDGSFLNLLPRIAVITNIDREHMDYYSDLEEIRRAFLRFANQVPFYGVGVLCGDDPNLRRLIGRIQKRFITYGTHAGCHVRASEIVLEGLRSRARVAVGKEDLGWFQINLPGRHNAINALAAIAVGWELGISGEITKTALAHFAGVARRFDVRAEIGAVTHLDDYGHHPTEIRAVLQAARAVFGQRRLIVLFQPHRYTRVAALADEFADAFADADVVVVTEIYPAGEKPRPGVTAEALLTEPIRLTSGVRVIYAPDEAAVIDLVPEELHPGDVLVTLGAGNVWRWGDAVMGELAARVERGGGKVGASL